MTALTRCAGLILVWPAWVVILQLCFAVKKRGPRRRSRARPSAAVLVLLRDRRADAAADQADALWLTRQRGLRRAEPPLNHNPRPQPLQPSTLALPDLNPSLLTSPSPHTHLSATPFPPKNSISKP
jgi:hypothetical protein